MKSIDVRQSVDSDVGRIAQLFYDTIQNINIKDYYQEEVDETMNNNAREQYVICNGGESTKY